MATKKKRRRAPKPKDWIPESAGGITSDPDGNPVSGLEDQPFTGPTWANDRRIADCGQARELYVRLYFENQLRAQSFAQIRNQIEGGRPFDPASLQNSGEGWRTNINFNDARSAFRRVSLPYWKMVHEVPQTISVQVHMQSSQTDLINRVLAENYDRFLTDWGPAYFMQFSGMTSDYVMYGPAHLMFDDADTPRYRWMPSIQILVPKRTKADVQSWELFCYKGELTASELLKHIRGSATDPDGKIAEAAAKDAGWNPQMIQQAIRMAAPGPANQRYFDPNFWQDMIVSNDLVIGGVWPPVSVIYMWAKSPDGKTVREYIFTEKSDVPDYLFEKDLEIEDFRRILPSLFPDAGSNGLYHSIKGFGVMNYYYATAINRMKCRALDSTTFGMGMNFIKEDDAPDETPPVENYSMVNIFPKGLDQLQWYPSGLASAIEFLGLLEQGQNENNFTFNEPQKDIAETKTAKQAVILSNIQNEMSTASSAVFLSQLGTNVFGEQMRRLCAKTDDPDAVKFQKRCIAQGVPPEFFKALNADKIEMTVKSGASPTMASPVAREQISQALMRDVYPMPDSNKRAILEFRTATLTGADGVKDFLLPVGTASDPRARREAIMENADLAQGMQLGQPPNFGVDPSDSHVEHADEHLKPLEQIVQLVMQKQPINHNQLIALQNTLPHIGGHLQDLEGNLLLRPQFNQLKARFMKVQSVTNGLITRLAKAQQQAKATGQELQPQDVTAALNGGGTNA